MKSRFLQTRPPPWATRWSVLLALVVVACGGGTEGPREELQHNPYFHLALTGLDPAGLPKGLQAPLSLTAAFEEAGVLEVSAQATWQSDNPAVATVDMEGRLRAVGEGVATLTATYCDKGRCATTHGSVRVLPAVLQSFVLGPSDHRTVGPSLQLQLSAQGTFSDGSTADVSRLLSWSTDNPGVLQVQAGDGLVTGSAVGQATVTASQGDLRAALTVTVTQGQWMPTAGLPVRLLNTLAFAVDERHVVATGPVASPESTGGVNGSHLQSYAFDRLLRTWVSKGSPSGFVNTGYSITQLLNGDLLLAGGIYFNLDSRALNFRDCSRYVAATGQWRNNVPAPAVQHQSASAGLLGDGRLLLIGGLDERPATTPRIDVFDPTTNTWSLLGNFPGVTGRPVTLLDGRLLLVSSTATRLYDAALNTWSLGPGPLSANVSQLTLLRDGRVLMTGGFGGNAPDSNRAEIYDPTTRTWAGVAPMAVGRSGHAAVLLADGSVMVAGGRSAAAGRSVERFDPATGQWSAMSPLGTARNGLQLVRLHDGSVLAVGGATTAATTSAELYW